MTLKSSLPYVTLIMTHEAGMRFAQLRYRTLIRLISAAASTKVNQTIVALVLITAAPIVTVFALLERAQSQSAILLSATLKGRSAYGIGDQMLPGFVGTLRSLIFRRLTPLVRG
jgi:hypothetical protein